MLPPLLVNQGRWSDLLKNLGVVKGLDHVELLSQLTGALVLENDRPEHKFLAGERLGWGQLLLAAAGAGVIGHVGIRNPAGSGIIVIVENFECFPQTTRRVYMELSRGGTWTQANTEQPRDTRWQPTGAFGVGAPNIAGQIVSGRSDTLGVVPFVVGETTGGFNIVATTAAVANFRQVPTGIVLAPGDIFSLASSDGAGGNIANEAFQASYVWRERTLEPTET